MGQTGSDTVSDMQYLFARVASTHSERLSTGEIHNGYNNRGRKLRTLKLNDNDLLLLAEKTNTLLTSWQGPFTVVKRTSTVNYLVDVRENHKKSIGNILKQYHSRNESPVEETSTSSTEPRHANTVSIIHDVHEETHDGFAEGVPYP